MLLLLLLLLCLLSLSFFPLLSGASTPIQHNKPHPREARIFWWSLYIFPGIWGMLALIAFLRFSFSYLVSVHRLVHKAKPSILSLSLSLSLSINKFLFYSRISFVPNPCPVPYPLAAYIQLVVVVALLLNSANVVGYTKCDKDAKQKLSNVAGQLGTSLLRQAVTSVASAAFGNADRESSVPS